MCFIYNQLANYELVSVITLFSNPDLIQFIYSGNYFFLNMAKGYWLSTGSINDVEGMQPYLKELKD